MPLVKSAKELKRTIINLQSVPEDKITKKILKELAGDLQAISSDQLQREFSDPQDLQMFRWFMTRTHPKPKNPYQGQQWGEILKGA